MPTRQRSIRANSSRRAGRPPSSAVISRAAGNNTRMDSRDPLHLQPDAPRKGTAGNDADLSQNGDAHDQECETNAHDQKRGEGMPADPRPHAGVLPPAECGGHGYTFRRMLGPDVRKNSLADQWGRHFSLGRGQVQTCLATMAADRLVMPALECAFEGQVAVPRTARCHLISVACPTRTRYARMLCVLHEDTRTASGAPLSTFRIFRHGEGISATAFP